LKNWNFKKGFAKELMKLLIDIEKNRYNKKFIDYVNKLIQLIKENAIIKM